VHQVGFSLHDYIETHVKKNIKKSDVFPRNYYMNVNVNVYLITQHNAQWFPLNKGGSIHYAVNSNYFRSEIR
jgi:hypothetical protein